MLKILFVLFALLIVNSNYGQTLTNKQLAEDVILKYTDYSYFEHGINKQSIDSFRVVFEPSAKIIFDIPFINTSVKNEDIKRISKDDRQQSNVINVFGKIVSLDLYIETLKREAEKFPSVNLDSTIRTTGKVHCVGRKCDTIIVEVEKHFKNTDWSVESKVKYLFYMRKTGYNMNIYAVAINDENISQTDIKLKLIDASLKSENELSYDTVNLFVTFSQPINNYSIKKVSDDKGVVTIEKAANNASLIYLDTVTNANGIRYDIPIEWKRSGSGKRMIDQPQDGFIISLKPYKWNGFAYSLFLSGGAIIPESMDVANFKSGSNFAENTGYKLGLNFNFTYFFNHTQWKINPKKWLFGVGSGISIDYQKSSITSNEFSQNTYEYIDSSGDDCQILFKGQSFSEKSDMISATVPLFVEFKKQIGKKSSIAVQTGVNVSFPASSNYEASGSFSRWGYYDSLNSQPITDDPFYNYFTDSIINYSGNIEYNTLLTEGFIKLKGFFNVFKKNPDNSLEIGLVFSMPFTASTNYSYPNSQVQDYTGYWMNTEDNVYHSVAYATEKVYKYYFGISIGINLIRYKPQ